MYEGTKEKACFSGNYMYIETSDPRDPGEKARLVSEVFTTSSGSADNSHCITFW